MWLKRLLVAVVGSMLMVMALACEREGPAERAGERVDKTVEEAGERAGGGR